MLAQSVFLIVLLPFVATAGEQKSPEEAAFTALFSDGDNVLAINESCVFITENETGFVPGGKPCGNPADHRKSRGKFPYGDEEAGVGWVAYSANGSTIAVTQGAGRERIITVNGKEVLRVPDPGGVAEPIGAAYWHGTSWVVEYHGKSVIVDGKQIGPEYDGVFNYQFIGGKPFYFFNKKGKVGISFDGVEQSVRFDDVAHRLCCELSMYNPAWSMTGVSFYARRGKTWYHVVALSSLDISISWPDEGVTKTVRDPALWKNPWLRVHAKTVDLEVRSPSRSTRTVSVYALQRTLLELSVEAWPYGRIIAVSSGGPQGQGDLPEESKKETAKQVEAVLTRLGVTPNWWP